MLTTPCQSVHTIQDKRLTLTSLNMVLRTELCIESWAKVQAIENHKEVAGELLFRRIFEIAPEAAGLFKFGEITEETYQSKKFLAHARGVIGMVDAAIDLLKENDMTKLTSVLKGLGERHTKYGVVKAHYPVVGQALIDTLRKALGEDGFTNEVRKAWEGLYGIISETMQAGVAQACIKSWRKVQAIENYKDVAGALLFRRIFELAPEAASIFQFGDITEETYQSEKFLRHARGVIGMVDTAVDLLEKDSMDVLTKALKSLGARHSKYGVVEAHYPVVGQALLDTLGKALGENDFTDGVKEGWSDVYGLISKTMQEGALEDEKLLNSF
mmetsp:Transcript_32874/g.49604  ORF Transcript_32874/g.49604 Transcript_32874/m.49604 type:complete len:328 (-) Transcript_32874:31-1014(-)